MKSLQKFVAEHAIFKGMSEEYLSQLVDCGTEVRFEPGRLVFRQGERAERCYLIRHGRVSLEVCSPTGSTLTIQTLEDGEVLGWSWLFPPYIWHFDARALVSTDTVALDGARVRGRCDEDPKFGYELMKRFSAVIAQRMQAARLQIFDLYGSNTA